MGQEKESASAQQEKQEEVQKEDGQKEEKKEEREETNQEIVLKVDMHCEACARKIAKSLKGFQGVEVVSVDWKASKVMVKGKKADPVKLSERIQKKSRRKVEIISPLPNPSTEENKGPNKPEEVKEENKDEQQQQLPPPAKTIELKIRMHCEACAQVLQKRIRKIRGVESVATDFAKDQVIVKGVIDPTKLVEDIYKRTRKQASIVQEEEEDEEEEKPKEEKKEEEKNDAQEKEDRVEEIRVGEEDTRSEIKRSEYWVPKYTTEYAYAPEFFSDENPHACSIM